MSTREQASKKSFADNRVVVVAKGVQKRYKDDSARYMASAITYFGFLSLFPLLLLGFSVTGFLLAGNPEFQGRIVDRIAETVPGIAPLLGENLDALQEGRAATGVIGLIGLVWSGMGVIQACRHALGRIFRRPAPDSILKLKFNSFGSLLGLGALALGAATVAGFAGGARGDDAIAVVMKIAGGIVAFGLDVVLFLVAYRVLTRGRGPSWGSMLPGALLGAAGWLFLKIAGSWYASRTMSSASEIYGTFAATLGVLVLIYLASRLFLYGAELNAVLMEEKPHLHDQDRARPQADQTIDLTSAEESSTPELVKSIAADASTLIRKEVALAKTEILQAVSAKFVGLAFGLGAGFLSLIALGFLGFTAAAALSEILPAWAAFLIVSVIYLGIAGLAVAIAMKKVRGGIMPKETAASVREDIEMLRSGISR